MTRSASLSAALLPSQNPLRMSKLQIRRLEEVVAAGWERSFYRTHWGFARLDNALSLIRSMRFQQFPVIRKHHLRDHWDEIMIFENVVDMVSSSGTTGRPVDIPVTRADEYLRVIRVRRLLRELGVQAGTRVLQLLSLNDLFTLGPVAWLAAKAEGACVIRCSPQRLDRILQAIAYLRPQAVIGNPFVMARLAEEAGDRWPSPDQLPDLAFFAVAATFDAQLQPTAIANLVRERWGLRAMLNQYGSSELGPIAFECAMHQGLHVHADHQFVELIHPVTGEPITNPDQAGEVVITGLSLPRGFVPIRYATGDIAAWLRHSVCPCGRTTPRLGPILGRVDHQLKLFGQTIFPDMLLSIVDQCPFVQLAAIVAQRDSVGSDAITVMIVPRNGHDPETVRCEVVARLTRNLAVAPAVEVVAEARLKNLEQHAAQHTNMVKIARFFDLRQEVGTR